MKIFVSLATILLHAFYPISVTGFAAVQKAAPPGELFPFQEEGVERLMNDQRLLLADEMGLGKTVQCIGAINRIGTDDAAILVVCPKSVLGVWEYELQTWLELPYEVQMASPKSMPLPSAGTITLINYDICHKYREALQKAEYDIVICDEAHYLKSISAKRTLAILGDGKPKHPGIQSPYLWLLTGTPVLNRPVELYPLLRAIRPDEFPSFSDFADRYCDPKTANHRGRFSMDYSGASNLVELSQRLEPIMLRRYKMDVLTQLPPKFRSCLCLTGSNAAEEERERLRAALSVDGKFDANQNLQDFGSDASDLMSYLGEFTDVDLDDPANYNKVMGSLATIRKETALTKLEPSVELLEDIILSQKVVVFAHHRELILALVERFGDRAVCVMGGMDTDARSEAVRSFQEDEDVRIFVGSIRAAGVGLTLTAASHVVFLEMDWSPGVMEQAEDRCHRVGQDDSVQVQYYVFKDTIDEWIAKSLLYKQSNIDQILPGKSASIESGYIFDFGKHNGVRLEDAPKNYVQFLVQQEVWRNRPALWQALAMKGIVFEEPPPLDAWSETVENIPDAPTAAATAAVAPVELLVTQTDHPRVTVTTALPHKPSQAAEQEASDVPANDIETSMKRPKTQLVPVITASPPPLSSRSTSEDIPLASYTVTQTDHPRVTVTTRSASSPTTSHVIIATRAPQSTSKSVIKPAPTSSTEEDVKYVFDFGKHNGKTWDDAPPNYRKWVLQEGIWKNRTNLKAALTEAGVNLQEET